jgi:fructose-specific phosphotransferase system IIC component
VLVKGGDGRRDSARAGSLDRLADPLVRQVAIIGVVAIGMTIVIISAGIDLSVGSVVGFSNVLVAVLMTHAVPILIALAAGAALGVLTFISKDWRQIMKAQTDLDNVINDIVLTSGGTLGFRYPCTGTARTFPANHNPLQTRGRGPQPNLTANHRRRDS